MSRWLARLSRVNIASNWRETASRRVVESLPGDDITIITSIVSAGQHNIYLGVSGRCQVADCVTVDTLSMKAVTAQVPL